MPAQAALTALQGDYERVMENPQLSAEEHSAYSSAITDAKIDLQKYELKVLECNNARLHLQTHMGVAENSIQLRELKARLQQLLRK